MSARELLEELRESGVELVAEGDNLRYRAKEAVTADLLNCLRQNKSGLLALLERERRRLEEAGRRGLVIRWAMEPGWITLHDPTMGEWHEVRASECSPAILDAANSRRRRARRLRAGQAGTAGYRQRSTLRERGN